MGMRSLAAGFGLCLLGICATGPAHGDAGATAGAAAAKPIYTRTEEGYLSFCASTSVHAYDIATAKLQGVPPKDQEASYAKDPATEFLVPTVERVYAAKFSDAWEYSNGLFLECTQGTLSMPASRSEPAHRCMVGMLIASIARGMRAQGASKEQVYAGYGARSDTAHRIIDGIYVPADPTPSDAEINTWKDCIAPLSGPG